MKRLLFASVLALACVLVGGAAATTGPSAPRHATISTGKAPSKPKKSGLCHIGEDTKTCNPNPLFAKDACDAVVGSDMQALANKPIGKGYQPYVSGAGLMCMWRVGGMTQSIVLHLYGGKNFTTSVEGNGGKTLTSPSGGKKWDLAQVFWWEMGQFQEDPGSTCPWPSLEAYQAAKAAGAQDQPPAWINPVKTTIEGYPAWVEDGCDPMPQADASQTPGYQPNFWLWRHVWVLDGDLTIDFDVRDPVATDLTTAQLIPYVEKVMSLYASTK